MDNKVSDYKLAESIVRKLCKKHGVSFVDAPIDFDGTNENALSMKGSKNVAHTIFKIVGEYINRSSEITGVQFMMDESNKDEFLIVLATNLRNFMYGENVSDDIDDEPHLLRLYQYPLIWTLMKDIICPIHNKELKNIKVIADGSAQIDIAKYYKQGEIPSKDISDEPFIFVNRINNRVVQSAFIFMESLRAMELSPVEVIKDIYETEIYDKYHGFLGVALDSDDDVNDFECTTMAILGINFYNLVSKKVARFNSKMTKNAQSSAPGLPNQFGYIGLLEKMIEPIRQRNDWSVYQNLEPYIKDFWNRVEVVRQKRAKSGHDPEVPFDTLLRIKSKQTTGYESDPRITIQELLSSKRVW
jgi:hypothetical protein